MAPYDDQVCFAFAHALTFHLQSTKTKFSFEVAILKYTFVRFKVRFEVHSGTIRTLSTLLLVSERSP